ncbi:MAG TPA: DedA family protein [Thermoanaerobaculia bacterium]|nr:DedA family protein [Thermoanaerobaculia bacterium]
MFHSLFASWMQFVLDYGYLGVFVLMVFESTALPVPAEVVLPPAAFWAAQGKLNIWLVILAATAGSWVGSAASYWIAVKVGRPIIERYGKYVHLSPDRLRKADAWFEEYGGGGIFVARLLPGIRHLISIPAGLFRMNFTLFSLTTIAGAGLYNAALCWFGMRVIGDQPALMKDPDALRKVLSSKSEWLIGFALVIAALYALMTWMQRRAAARRA